MSFINISTRIVNYSIYQFLSDDTCTYILHFDITLSVICHFGIHFFVVLRSRLTVTDVTPGTNKYYKLGMLLISTDLGLMVYPWFKYTLDTTYKHGVCLIVHTKESLIIWTLISDVFIGIYCLLIFVIPLKKHLEWENKMNTTQRKATTEHSMTVIIDMNIVASKSKSIPAQKTQTPTPIQTQDFSLSKLVHKVTIYSTIMIISTIIFMVTAAILNTYNNVPEIIC